MNAREPWFESIRLLPPRVARRSSPWRINQREVAHILHKRVADVPVEDDGLHDIFGFGIRRPRRKNAEVKSIGRGGELGLDAVVNDQVVAAALQVAGERRFFSSSGETIVTSARSVAAGVLSVSVR